MNRAFYLMFLLFYSITSLATECVDNTFMEEHLNIYLCQNYSNYSETRTLLFKARTKILNDYISDKKRSGQLQNKKIEIQLYDPNLTYNHLDISQGNNGYYVTYSGFPSIQQLKTFIDYFVDKNWKPFFTGDYQKVSNEIISNQIDRFFYENKTSKISMPVENVWNVDNLRLDYVNDTLKYYVDSISLNINPTSSLPIKIEDRFLLFQSDSIFVLEERNIIKVLKIINPITEDYDIYTHKKWVNICNGGKENWLYSYSYRKNKFYKRKE